MKKLKNSKGFTLMEMLIVVAIIAILIAIAIPAFTNQLEKAREAADMANIRSTYAEAMADYLTGDSTKPNGAVTKTAPAMTQTVKGWKYIDMPDYLKKDDADFETVKGETVTVTVEDDATEGVKVTLTSTAN